MMISQKIKAVIFDLDGVITDTAEYHFYSWKKLSEEEGIEFTRKDNEQFRGVSRRKCLDILLKGRDVSEEEKKEMAARKNVYYREYLKDLDKEDLLPGVEEMLNFLQSNGYKIAVASSSKNTDTVLENLGIKDIFDTVSDGYSVKKSKPAPDIFLHTAKNLKVSPEVCLVIEDAESGIKGAQRAGMKTVGVGPEERVGEADYHYEKVGDIDLKKILA
ncbi:MAG: beta-phosphoglucomutase [Halanaerobiaceae bacterium]